MKYYSIIAFISAAVISVTGILICLNKLKGFVYSLCKNHGRYKILGGYFISVGLIMLSCAVAALCDSPASIIYIALSSVAISIFISLIRRENL